ncbi:MAG TPA: ABC transporter ATP-binding protein [Clostridia bacterium]|nr:ABC transporter ATP-binding protein [Clostridia bacterium]
MIKELGRSVREYKKLSIITPILISLEVVIECIIPFITATLVNEIKSGCDLNTIIKYGIILIIMAFLSLTFGAVAGSTSATAACGFAKNLRKDMFYSIQNYSFENIDKFQISSLITRLTTDVTNVQNAYMMLIRVAVRAPLMMIFAFVMAFVMGGRMAWIFLVVVPILAIGLGIVIYKTFPLFKKVFTKYDALNKSIQENIKGMRVVKSFVREDYEQKKFEVAAQDVCADFTRAERILALNGPLMQFCMYVVMLFVLSFGSYTIITSRGLDFNIGQFSAILTYNFMILISLMMLSMVFVMITLAGESAKRIVEVINEKSTLTNPEHPVYTVKDGSVSFENVSFKYSERAERMALANINLEIKSGETIGIIGGTGSSKSSLIQLIPRLYDATEGIVKVGGVDVRNYDLNALRNQVAIVLQKNVLFSGTIKENLRWGNKEATDEELVEACKIACADEFINQFPQGYDTYIEQGGANLSGGQRQRLCIARALLKKPKILILDDSTSAVDTRTDAKIRKALREYMPETTKIIIAQRTSSVQDADRIIVMDRGTINGIGTHEQLLAENAIYREIYYSQNNVGDESEN